MKFSQTMFLVLYALGMSVGQMLFKAASESLKNDATSRSFAALMANRWFISGIVLYGAMTVLWTWILSQMPLNRAYPFVALSFVFTPIGSFVLFGEQIDIYYIFGTGILIFGLIILLLRGTP